jgi:hypothetical protein
MAAAKRNRIASSTAGIATDALPESPAMRREYAATEPSGLTVGGVAIEDIPGGHLIPHGNTDQGIEERLARPHASAQVTRDTLDKKIEERRDFRANELEPWEAPDPMGELVKQHVPAGFRGKFLSPGKIGRDGMRGYETVKGENGEPVKLGNMILGKMPETKAQARNRHYQGLGQQQMAEVHEKFNEEQQKLIRGAGVRSRARTPNPGVDDGLQEVRGNSEILR